MRSLGNTYPIILALIVFQTVPIFTLSDQRLCADPKCQDIISIAKASIRYTAHEKGLVSFNINSQIRVKSKSAGSDPSLWGIEVNGRQGYAPKKFIQEQKILISEKNLKYIVPVEPVEGDKQANVLKTKLNPSVASVEPKVSETVTTTNPTPPLSSEVDAATTTLNSSESELEITTTTPLTEPIPTEVLNKSLKEVATPVLNKMEIIDGTALPVIEDVQTEAPKEKVQLAEQDKKTTTTNEPKDTINDHENSVGTIESKSEIEDKISENNFNAPTSDGKESQKENKEEENAKPSFKNVDTIKRGDAEKELKNSDKTEPIATNLKNSYPEEKLAKEIFYGNELNKKNDSVKNVIDTDDKSADKTGNVNLKNPKIGTNVQIKKQPKHKDILLDSYEDDEDDYDEEDEDEFENDDDDENDDYDRNKLDLQSSSVKPTTQTPQQVTDSGYKTTSNLNYWEDADVEASTTAPVPKSDKNVPSLKFEKEKPADNLQNSNDLPSTKTGSAENATTFEEIAVKDKAIPAAIPTPISQTNTLVTKITKEAITTETPQVPSMTTPRPIFKKPDQLQKKESINQEEQQTDKVGRKELNEKLPEAQIDESIKNFLHDPYQQINEQKHNQDSQHLTDEHPPLHLTEEQKQYADLHQNGFKSINNQQKQPQQQDSLPIEQSKEQQEQPQDLEHSPLHSTEQEHEHLNQQKDNIIQQKRQHQDTFPRDQSKEEQEQQQNLHPLLHSTEKQQEHHEDLHQQTDKLIQQQKQQQHQDTLSSDQSQQAQEQQQDLQHPLLPSTEQQHHPKDSDNLNKSNEQHKQDHDSKHSTNKSNNQEQQQDLQPLTVQSNDHLNHGNPNEYYHQQAELSQNIDRTFDSTEIPVSQEKIESFVTSESVVDQSSAFLQENDGNVGAGSIEMITTPTPLLNQKTDDPDELPIHSTIDEKRDAGLFGTILGTVNTFVSKLRKQQPQLEDHKAENSFSDGDDELQRILYPELYEAKMGEPEGDDEFCEQLSPHHCPKSKSVSMPFSTEQHCNYDWTHINLDNFVDIFAVKVFEMRELLSCLAIASSTILVFLFGYYCFCNKNREGTLISKLNLLERSLLASHKENAILKDDLQKTRNKLTCIEDNSFGSNDMVIALRKELEINGEEKRQLEEQIQSLEKELETAAEAGLELNKIVAELINNQTGQESMIMNSVEDLQIQFNEQQKTILEINANLAEKSRENSELQLMLAEQSVRLNGEIASLQQDNDELEVEKSALQTRLGELKSEFEDDISKALEGKNVEIKRLQNEVVDLKNNFEEIHTKWQTSLAKIEALEECMKSLKKDSSVNIADVINVANVRAELLDLQKQRSILKSRLDVEMEARQHAEHSLQNIISEVDKLKVDFNQSEKDKLEAQTRLEVLSNYFKEKETQLQKELSLKEAIWLKQQGENTSTVDRLTAMQEEIQSLKSQNDALRAEIEAQLAAHKAQTGTLENRAHETWLAARQSERRFEEARAEAAALRRRLTELAGAAANVGEVNRTNLDGKLAAPDFNNAPSPIMPPPPLMDTNAGSPLLGTLPPPPHQFLPFMGPPPPPFLNLPPPPFLQSVEMRPAPLGRMMSPTTGRYDDREHKRRGDDYYEREYDDDYDDDDYDVEEDDYEYDDEDEQDERRRSRRPLRRSGGNGSDSEWHRDNYSPPPPDRSYRSQSPTDSRFNYTYDDETDLSPPPSPRGRRGRDGGGGGSSRTGSYHTFSPRTAPTASPNAVQERTSSKKGIPNSDSDKSHNSTHHKKKGKSFV